MLNALQPATGWTDWPLDYCIVLVVSRACYAVPNAVTLGTMVKLATHI